MARFSRELVEQVTKALEDMAKTSPSLKAALVVSDDGFEVARFPLDLENSSGFAAMASSVQALSEAVVNESSIGKSDSVVIQASKGRIVQLRIVGNYVLSAKFSNEDLMGRNLIDLRKTLSHLREIITSLEPQ